MVQAALARRISILHSGIRRLQSKTSSPSPIAKFLSTCAFVPIYVLFLGLVRLHLNIFGPLRVEVDDVYGYKFACNLPDLVQRYIYLFGIWEPNITDFVSRRLSLGDTFIDVGAHAGYYTMMASRLVGESGRVLAIEASPRIYSMLRNNLEINEKPKNVCVLNVAVADAAKEVRLYSGPESNLGMTSIYRRNGFRLEGAVQGVSLNDILESERITDARLVKIDIEGSEKAALNDIKGLLVACRSDAEFIVEISPDCWAHREKDLAQIVATFDRAGYHPYLVKNNYCAWQYLWPSKRYKPRRTGLDQLLQMNERQIDLVFSSRVCQEL